MIQMVHKYGRYYAEEIRGVRIPEGFKTWLASEIKTQNRAVSPYAIVQWQLYTKWSPAMIRKKVAEYKGVGG